MDRQPKNSFLSFQVAGRLWCIFVCPVASKSCCHVATYIENQEQHHRKKTFLEEYKNMLDKLKLNMMNDIFKQLE